MDSKEIAVSNVLIKFGFARNNYGYEFARTGILLALESPQKVHHVCDLVNEISEKHNTEKHKVERCIRHSVGVAFSTSADMEFVNEVFPAYNMAKGKVTIGEFIAGVAEYLRLKGEV